MCAATAARINRMLACQAFHLLRIVRIPDLRHDCSEAPPRRACPSPTRPHTLPPLQYTFRLLPGQVPLKVSTNGQGGACYVGAGLARRGVCRMCRCQADAAGFARPLASSCL